MTRPDVAVIGGGLLGRCLAWRASKAGARVALYEAAGSQGEGSAAWVAAGMIAPTSEAIDAGPEIGSMGMRSLSLWPEWLAELPVPVFYRNDGSLLLWHREDAGEAVRVQRLLASRNVQGSFRHVEGAELVELEPALRTRFPRALYVSGEAQVDNRALLQAVAMALSQNKVQCHWETFVPDGEFPIAGIVVDCRGMGARRIGRSCVAFAARSSVCMHPRSNSTACCGCCTRATRCTSFPAPKDDWLSVQPVSRAMTLRLFPSAASRAPDIRILGAAGAGRSTHPRIQHASPTGASG